MITFDFSDITAMIAGDELDDELIEAMEDTMTDIFVDLTDSPPLGTPRDTGAARLGWQIDLSNPMAPEVYNGIPYIGALNDGHSKQAPSGFVEAVIDKHTR